MTKRPNDKRVPASQPFAYETGARERRPLPRGVAFGLTGLALFFVAGAMSWNYINALGLNPAQFSAQEVARQMLVVILLVVAFFEFALYFLHRFITRQDKIIAEQNVKLKNYSTRLEELVTDQFTKLRMVEAQFQAVIANVPVILMILDADGRVTFAEGSGLATSGLKGRNLVGRSVFESLKDQTEVVGHLRRALNGERLSVTDRINGSWYAARYAPLQARGGNAGAILVALDVSEGQEAARRLEETEKRFLSVAEAVTCGMVASDGEKILYANSRATQMLGKKASGMADHDLTEVFSKESVEAVKGIVKSGAGATRMKMVTADGHDFSSSVIPIEMERKPAAMIVLECPKEKA